jgi:tetratricopeptide (TPR) repeat protein
VYLLGAAPGPYWLDSQELGAAGVELGVPHPTGFPLFCILARIAALVPIGELAFRIHLLSAACAAVAIHQAVSIVLEIADEDLPGLIGAACTGIVLASGTTFFRQATVTEVYAPTAAALAISLRLLLRLTRGRAGRRGGLSLALLAGLATTGLHVTFAMLLAVPLMVVYIWRYTCGARWVLAAPALASLGAAGVLAYLPIRSASGSVPLLDWGHPRTLEALIDHASGARIRMAYASEMLSGDTAETALRTLGGQVVGDLGVLVVVAAVAGAVLLAVRRRNLPAGIVLATVALTDLAYSVAINPRGIIERQDGGPLALCVAVLAGLAIVSGARRLGRAAPFAAGVATILVSFEPIVAGRNLERAPSRSDAPRAWSEAALQTAPPGAILAVESDSLAAGLFWLSIVERARPDVAVLVQQHLRDSERVAAVLSRARVGSALDGRTRTLVELGRPVRWETGVLPPPRGTMLTADLPVATLSPTGEAAPGRPLTETVGLLERIFSEDAIEDDNAQRLATRTWINIGVLLAARNQMDAAVRATERALTVTPAHPTAHLNAARFLLALDRDATAAEHARAAVRLRPGSADAWALLGILYARERRCSEAKAAFDRALALEPAHLDAAPNRAKLETLCPHPSPSP